MPINYNESKMYKIVCDETGKEWFNVTASKRLCTRLAMHKLDHKKNKIKDDELKDIMDRNNYYIEFVMNCPCKNKEDLNKIKRNINKK